MSFCQDPETRHRRMTEILRNIPVEFTPRSEIAPEIDLDLVDTHLSKRLSSLEDQGLVERRDMLGDTRRNLYRVTRDGAKWLQQNT